MMRLKPIYPTEHQEQVQLFAWAKFMERKYPELSLMFTIPNGGDRHLFVGRKMKAEGVRRGVPDICLPVARGGYHGLFIEMKRVKGGRVEVAQKDWLEALKEEGYRAVVCQGSQEAEKIIVEYLEGGEIKNDQTDTLPGN